jgi:hypothetical protein
MCVIPEESPVLWTQGAAARETLSYLDRKGIDAGPALIGAGLSRPQLSQDDTGVSAAAQYRFLELAAAAADDQLLGLHVAAAMDMRAAGILFYLTESSLAVSEALEALARYSATTSEALAFAVSRHNDEVILALRPVQELDEPRRQFFEFMALLVLRTLHKVTNRDFIPLRVTFTHARNADLREVHRFLRCPVEFAQGVNSWVLPQRVMDLPIVSEDSHLLRILTAHAEDLLAERHSATGLQSRVENQLVSLLPSGEARAAAVAQRLNMTLRSFTRYLAEEGTTFAKSSSNYDNVLPLVTWPTTACRSSRSPGSSVIRSPRRSRMPTNDGPVHHPGERESPRRPCDERGFLRRPAE